MPENRDSIKSRMLRTVANMWDYPGVENEAAFDPLVALLINACAAELAKINRDKKLSQSRLIEEVAQLLIPDADVRAKPAHAIVSARPSGSIGFISKDERLRYIETPSDENGKDFFFSPTAPFPLVNAEVKFQASDNNIYKIIDHKYKNVTGYAAADNYLPTATLYLGLELAEEVTETHEMTFYFNMLNGERKDFFFKHLKNSQWFLNNRELQKQPGYPSTVSEDVNLKDILANKYRTNDRACRDINRFYQRQFFTLKNVDELIEARGNIPEKIQASFDSDTLDTIDDNLLWLRIDFPKVVSPKILNDVFCFTNCFPVLNRHLHDFMHMLQDNLNIIPLKSSDYFFDVKKIVDSDNVPYHVYNLKGEQATEDNSVLLRTSGVGRFGAFEAKEELQYLLETLKDETASYAAIGTETIESIVNELNVLMGQLEEKVTGMAIDKTISYLVLRNLEASDSLFVEYWTTAGERANNIPAGTQFEILGRSNINPKSVISITPTVGGRNRLSEKEKMTSFKKTLLANNRLVTHEDIKAFCADQLGRHVDNIQIKKGLTNGMAKKEGLVRTIDIIITSNETIDTSDKEWDFLLDDLLSKICSRVAHSFPYRILLENNNNSRKPSLLGMHYNGYQ